MIPAPSQDSRSGSPKPVQKKPQLKKQPSQQTTDKITKPTKPPVDYQVLLLSLADEYLNAAHRHGTKTALVISQADVEEYYKLVSTGLGCLEAVLKVGRVSRRPNIDSY
jgi:protein tyrosine/serine phosphatase